MTELHINEATRSITLDGRPVSLGARAFDVLTYLSQHPDRVITKEELLDHVWADTLVEDSNLTVQIAGLRKALGKDTIKTVPGVGTIAGGALQGLVVALITRWIGAVFIQYFKHEMQEPPGGLANMARREWQRLTKIDELRKFVQAAHRQWAKKDEE